MIFIQVKKLSAIYVAGTFFYKEHQDLFWI